MSALSFIRDYGDISSEDSDSPCEEITSKKLKLPPPNLSKVSTVLTEEHKDDPTLHAGRIRSFPHVRGNWATFVYVKYPQEDAVLHLINKLKDLVLSVDKSCQICDNIHLSLSRTVVLQYHLITTFTTTLQTALNNIDSFDLQFDAIELYSNDDNTRTFIALKADHFSKRYLLRISKKVDEVLKEFKLQPFYKEPSFHSSILWVNGNKKSNFEGILDQLNRILAKEIENNLRAVLIDRVQCQIGNKYFQFSLS
ncbi:U6 snRNA phosphodiesterase 1 [Epargyreus clarus]|uniref:U6 snRNA phosphodiesterase 1 n=1 Tax=Epargyreus clarus TaxID=520877 RepID=UPI003C2D844C